MTRVRLARAGVLAPSTNTSVAAMAELWLDKPVIAIDTATCWYALRKYGIRDKVYGLGSLPAEH